MNSRREYDLIAKKDWLNVIVKLECLADSL